MAGAAGLSAAPLLAARAFLDVPTVVLDSDLQPEALERLTDRLAPHLATHVTEARTRPKLLRGSFGSNAGALGAATLPLFESFGPRPPSHESHVEGALHIAAS